MGWRRADVLKTKAVRTGGSTVPLPKISGPEEKLWLFLKHGHPDEWVREFKFHPTRRWRFDFALPYMRLAVEVDGLVYGDDKGGHQTAKGYENDRTKDLEAQCLGWQILRVTPKMIKTGLAFWYIEELTHVGHGGKKPKI